MGRQDERRRPDTNRRGDEVDGGEGFAGSIGAKKMTRRTQTLQRALRQSAHIFVAACTLSACFALSASSAFTVVAGQMTSAPASAYRRDPGIPSSVVPKPLREVGYDQHLD